MIEYDSESSLIKRCKKCENQAFRDLILKHSEMIQRIATRMCYQDYLREDIFQEVVKTVILSIKNFKGRSKFSTWLYRITVNTALKMIQKEKRLVRNKKPEEVISEDNAALHLERAEEKRHVLIALSNLPKRQRECASMFYYAEMAVSEIAEELSIKENAVKTALFKARRNIALYLERKEVL